MEHRWFVGKATWALGAAAFVSVAALGSGPARADGDLSVVKHIIIAMQENHSFDNYFGTLPYGKKHKYHKAKVPKGGTIPVCKEKDHKCVDGLTCTVKKGLITSCTNSNVDRNGTTIPVFHQSSFCVGPDLDHSWKGSHQEANYDNPNDTLNSSPNDGFVRVNYETEQHNDENDTMGYYTRDDLPFYYGLAETFAISDSYFSSLLGQTLPNRQYFLAATSFGHLTTDEILLGPPSPFYKPITGTVFDLLATNSVTWANYYSDPLKYSLVFTAPDAHQKPVTDFATDAQNGTLPDVVFIDPSGFASLTIYDINGTKYETDEHPPADIRAGQYFMWKYVVEPLRNSPSWDDSILIITYDEHGGYYDHVTPPPAAQGGQDTPDGIAPGQCADLSNPPASTLVGGGFNCNVSRTQEAPAVCPGFTATGPYPASCPTFNQLGFRVPFIAVSPFAKKKYVSHVVSDHTSLLALIENRFLSGARLTERDANANGLEDLFDFKKKKSRKSKIPGEPPPPAADNGCPFGS
jgi:phospholipase C